MLRRGPILRGRRRASAVAGAVACFLVASAAHAQRAAVCADDAYRGQQLRDEGKLMESRKTFSACASSACPAVVQRECGRWLEEVDARLPSVVIAVTDGQGRDANAEVTVDGAPVSVSGGRALTFDPGEHVVRATSRGPAAPSVEKRLVLREGEKDRRIELVVRPPASPAPSEGRPQAARGSIPVLTWVLGGVAVAGGVGFGVFWSRGTSRADELRASCSPNCPEEQVDEARASLNVARVSLGVGVAAAIGAVAVLLLQPRSTPPPRTTASSLPVVWQF